MQICAYVNPVIAVFLGWALLGEQVTNRMFLGMLVIVAGVLIITIQQRPASPRLRACAENAS